VILITLVLTTAYAETVLGGIDRNPDKSTLSSSEIDDILQGEATGTGPTISEDEIIFADDPTEIVGADEHDEIINILLIGQDRRAGEGRQRSDAMILCTIDKNTNTLTMTSFLRDMYVQIPGYSNNKINACYAIGGMDLLDACLEKNFGVRVDANVEVDFSGFMKLIDMMGGVEIELTQAEADYLNYRGNWGVTGNDGWTLSAGKNLLNGSQALAYSRIRALGMDFERTERQRKVITALIGKAKTMSLTQLLDMVNTGISLITTDMTDKDIVGYTKDLFDMLDGLNIVTQRVPVDDSYRFGDVGGVGDCIILDFEVNRQFLLDTLKK